MKTTIATAVIVLGSSFLVAQQPPSDPLGVYLYPPELLMQNQKALGLTEEQKNYAKTEVQKAQSKFTDLQWQLQSEMEAMSDLLKQDRVDEQQSLNQLEKILNLEREIKRTQITLMVRIKNKLSPEQQAQLREMKNRMIEIAKGKEREARKREMENRQPEQE